MMLTLAAGGARGADAHNSDEEPALAWLRDFLADSSVLTVTASDDHPREVVTTRTSGVVSNGAFILEYERSTYAQEGPSTLNQHQLIMYSVRPDDLDAATLSISRFADSDGEGAAWIVSIGIVDGADFVSYDNLVESRKDGGALDLTRSRGRVRQVALGYFSDRARASELGERFRAYLRTLDSQTPEPLKRPTQSGA